MIANALQGECEISLKENTDTCYGVAFTIYNRYNKGYGSIYNIIKSAYYGYKSNRVPKQVFIDIAVDAANKEDFTNGSVYAFSYPADVNYLDIKNTIPTYKTNYTWFYSYYPVKKIAGNQKAITPEQCIKLGKCHYVTRKVMLVDKHGVLLYITKDIVYNIPSIAKIPVKK